MPRLLWNAAVSGIALVLLVVSPAQADEAIYRLDEAASTAGFRLGATLHEVRGVGAVLRGELRIRPAGEGMLRVQGEVSAAATDLDTGNARRDRKMRERTLAVAEHPWIVFRSREARGDYPAGLEARTGTYELLLRGSLEIRGVARDREIPVRVRFDGDRLVADGEFEVPFGDHGIPDPSVFLLRVKKFVQVHFHLEARREQDGPEAG